MRKIFILLFALIASSISFADEKIDELNRIENSYGITIVQHDKNNIEIDINQVDALSAIPKMQMEGLLNPDISQTTINMKPIFLTSMVAFVRSPAIIMSLYSKTNLDVIKVKEYILLPDNYGNMEKHLFLSFNFTRALNNKVNWENIDHVKFMRIIKNRTLTHWYQLNVKNEL